MKKLIAKQKEPASFRDPSGFIYYQHNQVFRQINAPYAPTFQKLAKSHFLQNLINEHLLIPYQTVSNKSAFNKQARLVLKTKRVPFISYPYEWSFSQLKDAALLTLKIQKKALDNNFSLKDASAFNIQFFEGKPILIDVLSFEEYQTGKPWIAYQQFCQHFLAPLLLMSYVDIRLSQLWRIYLDGIPLDLVSKLLPKKTYLQPLIAMHLHLHARNQQRFVGQHQLKKQLHFPKANLYGLVASLETLIQYLKISRQQTEWEKYYTFTNYSSAAFKQKQRVVNTFLKRLKPKTAWDLGGNTGEFSRLASNQGIHTISFDLDPLAIEKNYLLTKEKNETHLLPLLLDLTNPSAHLGWALSERQSIIERGPTDVVMALALIHHLSISHNLPFEYLADFLAKLGTFLIIEFVPKTDSQVKKLLATRKDIFPWYQQDTFEKIFARSFTLITKTTLGHGSVRTLYLFKRK